VGSEGGDVVQEAACRDLEVRWVRPVVGRLQEPVVAEVVVQLLLAGSSIKRCQRSAPRPYILLYSPLVIVFGQSEMLHQRRLAICGHSMAMTIPASPSAALVIGLAMDMLATDGSTAGFEASSPVPVRRLPAAAPTSLPGSEGAIGELMALESGGRDGDRGVSDAGVTLEYVVAGVGCCCTETGSVEGVIGASIAGAGVSAAVVGVVVDAEAVDVPIAAAAAYLNGGSVGGRDDPLLTALAIDVVEKFGAGIGGFGAAGAIECRESELPAM
jgi:hypothetical protein